MAEALLPTKPLGAGTAAPDALALTFRTPPWLRGHVAGEVTFRQRVSWVTNRGSVKEDPWWMSWCGQNPKSAKDGGARSWESRLLETVVRQGM